MRSLARYAGSLAFGALAASLVAAVPVTAAQAAEPQYRFDIPAQELGTSLRALAQASNQQITFNAADVHGKRAPALRGSYSTPAALDILLRGSGMQADRGRTGIYIVRRASAVQSPPPLREPAFAQDTAGTEEIVVTAQKREESIQDVPIAVSAFTPRALDEQKIEGGFDLLRGVPNVTFSKNNYSGYNFSIRGVGTKSISATSDPGVAVSFNNVALIRNRLFEQEYLDIERVEVLRGPQGTLYGRNATAGVVNVITAKPDLDDWSGSAKLEVGNYDAMRATGMLNVPLVPDVLAIRGAVAWTSRDGYGHNIATGQPVDGRNLWSTRLTVGFEPTSRLRINATWEHFEEDDDRLRTGKQLCHRDPGPTSFPGVTGPIHPVFAGRLSQGCMQGSLYDEGAYQAPNGLSIPFIVAGQLIATLGMSAPYYLPDGTRNPDANYVSFLQPGVDPYNVAQPRDLRTISSTLPAKYRAKADIFSFDVNLELSDSLTFASQTLYNKDRVYSEQDYHRFSLQPTFENSTGLYTPSAICGGGTQPPCTTPSELVSFIPGGIFTDPQLGPSNAVKGMEISSSESWQFSQEIRLTSDFDGPVNFSAGGNYLKFKGLNDYYLFYNIVTMLAQGYYNASPNLNECGHISPALCMKVDTNPLDSLAGDGHNYFRNRNPYELESIAGFGELYWRATNNLKFTAGLRYTDDRKTFTPWRSQLLVMGTDYGPSEQIKQRWGEFSGRIGFDWKPAVSFTDETMVYAFYSRGYKGGGANPPPAQPVIEDFVVAEVPALFEPEFVNAFEVGIKNSLLGGRLTLNGSAFFYDYKNYQVSKVYDRTIVNENFDAKVWGAELEAAWQPTRQLRLNATVGYLGTRIADGEKSIDIFNRTQGREGWSVMTPWIQQTSNCILPNDVLAQALNIGIPPGLSPAIAPIVIGCLMWLGNNPFGLNFNPDDHPDANRGAGFYADLSGNELPNSPHMTLNLGAQFTQPLGGWDLVLRGDYYRQSGSYARVYNLESDRLRAWGNLNLSLTLARPADDLVFQAYVKNVFDRTPITDAFLNSDSTGMTTNVFTLDPRIVGFSVRKGF